MDSLFGGNSAGWICPSLAIAALSELGIDISDHRLKSTELFRTMSLDWVITVCDDAAENCPVWLGQANMVHFGLPNLAKATGSDDETVTIFRQVRDDIRDRVLGFLPTVA